uniref:DUF7869 domain-containing protein n=1 Tax=Graphocephala atropunctata TaxID=36148 RepID=A0A1B6KHW1_9HEMI
MADDVVKKRRKKGEGRLSEEIKKLRNAGKAYITSTNMSVSAKHPPSEQVVCKCKYDCKNIPYDQKMLLFNDFYKAEHSKQQNYLLGLMQVKHVARRRHGHYEDAAQSRRQTTVLYTVPNGEGDIVQVCKNTFCNIFAVSGKRCQLLVKHKQNANPVYTEKRGNKQVDRKFSNDDRALVFNHIQSFPRDVSHYGRKDSGKEYLSPDLNISRLYQAFKQKYPDSPVTYRYYYLIFNKNFKNKLSFKQPRTDTCPTCDLLSCQIATSVGAAKVEFRNKLKLHHLKAEKARREMKQDFTESQSPNSRSVTFALDLEKVLSLPTLTHTNMYYLRQLSNFNLCTHFHDNTSMMNLWHEGITGRGGNEIASCILRALKEKESKHILTAWSDNCCGQNKNKMLVFLWVYLTCIGMYQEINHKFLVGGHSFLNCDRDFAAIEKRKRVTKCIVPEDLKSMIENVKLSNPFIVNILSEADFFDFKKAADSFINTAKVNISKMSWIRTTSNKPGKIMVKKTFSDLEQWTEINVFKKGVTRKQVLEAPLPLLLCKSRITEDKKTDLKTMLDFLVKPEHKMFFEELIQ